MQMETLPPKYLKPIIIQGKNYTVKAEAKIDYSVSQSQQYQTGEQTTTTTTTTTTTSQYTTGGADFTTGGTEFTTGATDFSTGGAELTTGSAEMTTGNAEFTTGEMEVGGAEFTASSGVELTNEQTEMTTGENFESMAQPTEQTSGQLFQTTQTTTTTSTTNVSEMGGSITGRRPVFKLLRQGSGISPTEQKGIVSTAIEVIEKGLLPVSNNTASKIKKNLGGDWLVIYYPQGKAIDFNMTCVQGNDYMYFTLDNNAYQVCRLR